jgi:hypothetical protein
VARLSLPPTRAVVLSSRDGIFKCRMPIADVSEKGKTRPKLDFGRALLE